MESVAASASASAPGRSPYRRIIRQSSVYAIGNAAVKLSGLILAPWYLNTSILAQAEFGYFVLLEVTAQLAIPLAGSGIAAAALVLMSKQSPESDRAFFTAFLAALGAAGAACAVLWALAPTLAASLLDGVERTRAVQLTALYCAFKIVGLIPYMALRASERAGWYVASTLGELALLIAGVYWWMVLQGRGLEGIMLAYTASAGVGTGVLSVVLLANVRWRPSLKTAREILRFSTPLALVALALPVLHMGDRYLLQILASAEELAVYGWAARLGGVLNLLVVQSLQLALMVVGVKEVLRDPKESRIHLAVFRHFSVWVPWTALGIALFSYDLTALLSDNEDYLRAAVQVYPLAIGVCFYGLYTVTVNLLYASGNTGAISRWVGTAAATNIALNFVLIPLWGAMGAAVATALSYALLLYATTRSSERAFKIRFAWRTLVIVTAIATALWLAALPSEAWSLPARLAYRVALATAFVPAVLLSRVYTLGDVRALYQKRLA